MGYIPSYFFGKYYIYALTIYHSWYIIKTWKGNKANKCKALERRNGAVGKKKRQKKKPIKWKDLAINALIDLIIGTVLILIDKLLN